MPLSVPSRDKPLLKGLATRPVAELGAILEALRSLEPSTVSIKKLAPKLATASPLSEAESRHLLQVLFTLHSLPRVGIVEQEEVVPELIAAIKDKEKPVITDEQLSSFREFISAALRDDGPLGLLAKGSLLVGSQERLLLDARILTDLRPVFDDSEISTPGAFIALHSLRLVFDHGGEPETIQINLDKKDLRQLVETAQRALSKEDALHDLALRFNIPHLETED